MNQTLDPEVFEHLCGLKNEMNQVAMNFKEALEAVCEQSGIKKPILTKMINAHVKDEMRQLKEDTDELSELLDALID